MLMSSVLDTARTRTPRRVPFNYATRAANERADRAAEAIASRAVHSPFHQDALIRGSIDARHALTPGSLDEARYALNALQREYSLRSSVRRCGRNGWKCGLAECSTCSTSRATQQRRDLMHSLTHNRTGTVLMWTATLASSPDLRGTWRALSSVISATVGGGWMKARGVVGYARVVEPELGVGGWHPHAHSLIVFRNELSDAEVETFSRALTARYLTKADRTSVQASPAGQDVRRAENVTTAVDYMTKTGVRLYGNDTASRLWAAVAAGDHDALVRVHELEQGAHRRRRWTTTGVCAPVLDFDEMLARGIV